MDRDTTSVMSKVTATLGRNFIRSKEFQEAQMMGMDPVCVDYSFYFKCLFCSIAKEYSLIGILLKAETTIYQAQISIVDLKKEE